MRQRPLGHGRSGDAEVDDLDVVDLAVGQKEVAGLEVAMHEALAVQVRQRVRDAPRQLDRLLDGEGTAAEALLQVVPVEPGHDEVRRPRGVVP